MDLKRHEDTILLVTSITIAGIIVFILKDFYIEYVVYFGWIMLYIVHVVIVWIIVTLTLEKIKRFLKKK